MRHPEHDIHRAVADFLTVALRHPATFWTSIDHAHAYNRLTGAMRKARGVKPGIPDVHVAHAGKVIWIELKSRTGAVSIAQKERRAEIIAAGGHWHLGRSVADVEAILNAHGVPLSARTLGLEAA